MLFENSVIDVAYNIFAWLVDAEAYSCFGGKDDVGSDRDDSAASTGNSCLYSE